MAVGAPDGPAVELTGPRGGRGRHGGRRRRTLRCAGRRSGPRPRRRDRRDPANAAGALAATARAPARPRRRGSTPSSSPATMGDVREQPALILDCDPGHDDTVAIVVAAAAQTRGHHDGERQRPLTDVTLRARRRRALRPGTPVRRQPSSPGGAGPPRRRVHGASGSGTSPPAPTRAVGAAHWSSSCSRGDLGPAWLLAGAGRAAPQHRPRAAPRPDPADRIAGIS